MKNDQKPAAQSIFRQEAWQQVVNRSMQGPRPLQRNPRWVNGLFLVVCLVFVVAIAVLSIRTTEIWVMANGVLSPTAGADEQKPATMVTALYSDKMASVIVPGQQVIVRFDTTSRLKLDATVVSATERPADAPDIQAIREKLPPRNRRPSDTTVLVTVELLERPGRAISERTPCTVFVNTGSTPLIMTLIPGLREAYR